MPITTASCCPRVLAGDKSVDEIVINPRSWYEEHGIALVHRRPGRRRSTARRRPSCGRRPAPYPYDKLLLATGSKPLAPPIPGLELPGVCAFRDIADVETMIDAAARSTRRAVVIGGGLLGLEAAWGLKRRGMSVARRPPDADADGAPARRRRRPAPAARSRRARHRLFHQWPDRGDFRHRARRRRAPRRRPRCPGRSRGARDRHPAQYRSRARRRTSRSTAASWSATTCAPAIPISSPSANASSITARSSAWWRRSGSRPRSAAARLAGDETAAYVAPPVFTSLKITGVDVFSAGALAAADEGDDEITLHDARRGIYKKRDPAPRPHRRQRCFTASVADGPWYLQLMRDKRRCQRHCAITLVFGRAFAEQAGAGRGARSTSPRWPTSSRSAAATASPRARSARPSATRG